MTLEPLKQVVAYIILLALYYLYGVACRAFNRWWTRDVFYVNGDAHLRTLAGQRITVPVVVWRGMDSPYPAGADVFFDADTMYFVDNSPAFMSAEVLRKVLCPKTWYFACMSDARSWYYSDAKYIIKSDHPWTDEERAEIMKLLREQSSFSYGDFEVPKDGLDYRRFNEVLAKQITKSLNH